MSKLTDGNNAAQPELAFQCKAVQDFHMHQAQEAEFLLNASSPDAASPITTSQLKCNLSASADTDTGDDERDDGGVNEQPKACTSSLVHLKPPKKLTCLSCCRQKATHHAQHCKCFTDQAYCYH